MGIIFIARPNHIVGVLPTLIGILILLDGGMRIQTAKDAKVLGYERWWLVMILGAAVSLLGLLLNIKPFESAAAMMMLVITLLIDGIQNLWLVLSTVKVERKTIINAKKWREVLSSQPYTRVLRLLSVLHMFGSLH